MEGNTLVKSDFRQLSMHPLFNLALTTGGIRNPVKGD